MSLIGVEQGHEPIRQEVFTLTSGMRRAVEKLESGAAFPDGGFDDLRNNAQSFAQVTLRLGHSVLQRWGEVLDRISLLGHAATRSARPGARDLLSSLLDIVGVVERSVDDCLDGEPETFFQRHDSTVRDAVPETWRSYLDLESLAFEERLKQLEPPTAPSTPSPAATPPPMAANQDASDEAAFQRELFDAFMTEVSDAFERCEELLVRLEKAPRDADVLNALFREFHTLKGAAAAVELTAASEQLHEGESLLQALRDGEVEIGSSVLVDFLLRLEDSVRALIDRACGRPIAAQAILNDVPAQVAALMGKTPPSSAAAALRAASPGARPPVAAARTTASAPRTGTMDSLPALAELRAKVAAGQIDPQLLQIIDALDQRAQHFSQVAASLQQEVVNLRTVQLDGIFRRLQRPVRDAARQEGKFVDLQISGGDLRVDRTIADKLSAPLLHLVRNAVAHGIEVPALREAHGKDRGGKVCVAATRQGQDLVVSITDDGAGLDYVAIRTKAAARGWIEARSAVSDDELAQLIFRPGFSTRDEVNELAGRGVGMDVVARDIEELRGRVQIESRRGAGTTIRLVLPETPSNGGGTL